MQMKPCARCKATQRNCQKSQLFSWQTYAILNLSYLSMGGSDLLCVAPLVNKNANEGRLTCFNWTFRHDTSKMCNSQLYLFLDFGKLFSFLSCCDMSDMSDMLSPIFHLFSPMFHLFSPIFHLFSPIFHLFSRNFHLFSPIFHLFSPIFHLFSPNFHLFHVFHAYFHVDFPHFWFGSCQGSPSSGPLAEAAARSCLTVATHGEVPKVASCFWRTQKWRGDFQEIFKKIQRCSKI